MPLFPLKHLPILSFNESLVFCIFCALVVHKIYNKYEIDPARFLPTIALLVGAPLLPSYFLLAHFELKILALLVSFVVFYLTLVSSIVFYRMSPFHLLAKYPGPLVLKISKFASVYYACDGKQYTQFKRLHDKYGPVVRVGPNEISFCDVEAIPSVLVTDGMRKGPLWKYHIVHGSAPSVLSLRDVSLHRERRKLWNRGFTSASLKEYQPILTSRVLQLVDELRKRCAPADYELIKPVDLASWIAYFSYDFMGDLVFGGGFDLMRDCDKDGIRTTAETFMRKLGILQHLSWTKELLPRVSAMPKDMLNYREFGIRCFDRRKEQRATRRDLFHYITNECGFEGNAIPKELCLSDVLTAIIAGADTTSTVLSGLFFYLTTHPGSYKVLQKEVDTTFPPGEGEPFDATKLAGMPYLNAVINESLRLQPSLPTSVQRSPLQGSGGNWVAGRFVPENTGVHVCPYVLHRDERYFSPLPNEFLPERWLDTDRTGKYITNTAAFIPFSSGPANCAGKNLALLEMRMVVATLLQNFDVTLADEYDPRSWEEELCDFFVFVVGKLPVVLTPRE